MKTFARLPFTFDAIRLQKELQTCVADWIAHFNTSYYDGDWSGIALRSPVGKMHGVSAGSVDTTDFEDEPILATLPYTKEVLSAFKTELCSVRFLRLSAGSTIQSHKDYDLVFWDGYVRIHVPVFTNEKVIFKVAGQRIEMHPGECWFADFSQSHSVYNGGTTDRIHLVIDCKVNDWLKQLFVEQSIIQQDEQAPNPQEHMSKEKIQLIIENLKLQGTATALEMVADLEQKMEEAE